MPSEKETVQAPAAASNEVLEPEPPDDLWEKMAAINAKHKMWSPIEPPPNSFTRDDYAIRFNISLSTAKQRLQRLVMTGDVVIVGCTINNKYYYRVAKK